MPRPTLVGSLAAAALLSACAGGGDATLPPLTPATARLEVVSGDVQRDTILQVLPQPVTVRVSDDAGHARPGVRVTFAATEPACGHASAGSAVTGGDGRASDRWELGTRAGLCELTVSAVDAAGAVLASLRVTATVAPGPMDTVRFLRSSPTFHPAGGVHAIMLPVNATYTLTAIHLRASDRYGNPIAAPQIFWGYDGPAYVVTPYMTTQVEGFTSVYPSAPHRDTLFVLSLVNLAQARWRARWTCHGGQLRSNGAWLPVDSMRFDFDVDSAGYTGDLELSHVRDAQPVATAAVRFRGTLGFTLWWADGTVQRDNAELPRPLDAFTPASPSGPWGDQTRVGWQLPNALQTYTPEATAQNNQPRWIATRTLNYQYAGGGSGWCFEGMQTVPSTFLLSPI
jgi:hypothetical protein